ncbi:MAG: hypothetical protein ACTSRA_15530 [Promethearchaeota archaeon]
MKKKKNIKNPSKASVTTQPRRNVVLDRFAIFLSTIVFLMMIIFGVYTFFDDDIIIKNDSEYIGGPIFLAAFFISPLILLSFRFKGFRIRNVFFSQLSLFLCILAFVGIALIPGSVGMIMYNWWYCLTLLGGATGLYLLAFILRKRERYVIGGFLIGMGSILAFWGLLGIFAWNFPVY